RAAEWIQGRGYAARKSRARSGPRIFAGRDNARSEPARHGWVAHPQSLEIRPNDSSHPGVRDFGAGRTAECVAAGRAPIPDQADRRTADPTDLRKGERNGSDEIKE